jgi:hypothetical protein
VHAVISQQRQGTWKAIYLSEKVIDMLGEMVVKIAKGIRRLRFKPAGFSRGCLGSSASSTAHSPHRISCHFLTTILKKKTARENISVAMQSLASWACQKN